MQVYEILQKAAPCSGGDSDSKGQRFESPRPHQTPRSVSKHCGAFFVKKQVLPFSASPGLPPGPRGTRLV